MPAVRDQISSLRDERGIALVLALMVMVVLSIVTTGVIYYTQQSEHQSTYSRSGDAAYRLAESGLNNAMAILGNSTTNAATQAALPSTEATASSQSYVTGTAKWWGTYAAASTTWTVYGEGIARNPDGTGGNIVRTINATVQLTAMLSQNPNNSIWNYIYSTGTGHTCDQTLQSSVTLKISLYVTGNLCTQDSSAMAPATAPPSPAPPVNLYVGGTYTSISSSHIGASGTGNAINQAIIVGGCNGHSPCKWNGGGDPVWATTTASTATSSQLFTPPVADFAGWYQNANLGPKSPCTTTSGTPPVFENEVTNPTRNNSVPGTFNLTPSSSYTCKSATGELSWNASTKVLTVNGVIYIDGSATSTANVASYTGEATLYLSGTFTMTNSSQFCGAVSNNNCDFTNWNPNSNMLIICAANMGNAANAISLSSSGRYQGGLFASNSSSISISNSEQFEGPVIGGSLSLVQSVQAFPLPVITNIPPGAPTSNNVYEQPQPPSGYSG